MHGSESCCNSLVYVSSGPSVDSFLKLEFCQCFHPSSHEMALTWFFWICLFFFFNLSYQPDYCYFVCQNSLRGSREIQIVDLASLWERYTDTQTYIHGYIYANPYPLLSWDKYCGNEGS